jgi:3-phosphoshikimate 1-carboxyvinyltransferase
MLGSLADGTTRIRNFLPASDCLTTLDVVRSMGIEVTNGSEEVLVHGRGLRGWREPARPVECSGSGTTMRLMAGLLAGLPMYSVLAGNAQLSRRPMDRVADPLRLMGAMVLGREDGRYPPLAILGGRLQAILYKTPVASAQVKSAVLLAGLFAHGITSVMESATTRDHTERMLRAMGVEVETHGDVVRIHPAARLEPLNISVPGDISSAAFLLAVAAVVPGSSVTVPGVGLNPGRVGILRVLERMGADLHLHNERVVGGEPVADVELRYGPLRGVKIEAGEVPSMIDELPVLAVIATQSEGVTEVRGAGELRVKETDRIATTVEELRRMGAHIEALPDGFLVEGPTRLHGARVESHDDHRLAMSLAVAALAASGETTITDTTCVDDSFPGFEQRLAVLLGETRV